MKRRVKPGPKPSTALKDGPELQSSDVASSPVENGIHCVCSSFWDIGPQIECEQCGAWQHVFCMGMFGKETNGYACYSCNSDQVLPNADHQQALRAFSAYAFSLPVVGKFKQSCLVS